MAEERAATEVAAAEEEARVAVERARAEAVDAVRRSKGSRGSSAQGDPDELNALRKEVQQLRRAQVEMAGRMRDAERRAEAVEGEATTAMDEEIPLSDRDGSADGDGDLGGDAAPMRSLRSRLADAAARKKGDKLDPSAGVGP